jgi:hypothetical protein
MSKLKGESSTAAVEAVNRDFADAGLPLPPISSALAARLQQLASGIYATRTSLPPIYQLERYAYEYLHTPPEPYLVIALGGHGIASQAMHYYLVVDKIAIFLQISYINMLNEKLETANRIKSCFQGVKMLFKEMKPLPPQEKRLLIIESDISGSGWGWIVGCPDTIDPQQWHSQQAPLFGALAAVIDLQSSQ